MSKNITARYLRSRFLIVLLIVAVFTCGVFVASKWQFDSLRQLTSTSDLLAEQRLATLELIQISSSVGPSNFEMMDSDLAQLDKSLVRYQMNLAEFRKSVRLHADSVQGSNSNWRQFEKTFATLTAFGQQAQEYISVKNLTGLRSLKTYANEQVLGPLAVMHQAQVGWLETRVDRMWQSAVAGLLLASGLIVFVGAFIFRPMEREIVGSHSALQDARVRAEAADRAKSDFLANMSHEIRTPMNGVLGMTELLSQSNMNQKQQSYVDAVASSGTALLSIINDILDFSKIDAGKMELDPFPFNLASTIQDIVTLMSVRLDPKMVEIAVRYQPDLVENFVGDVGRIRQVLTNLIGNAVKFTSEGYILVDVSGTLSADSCELAISITDTGIGIEADHLDKIFDQFEQADASTTRRYAGTGLGLAITRRLIELMGGNVVVTSTIGEGSTFKLVMNLPVTAEQPATAEIIPDLRELHVLAVDDMNINLEILEEQLKAWGMRPEVANGADEAFEKLRIAQESGDPFQLAILDFQMPEKDGGKLAIEIKEHADLKDTPLIILTSVGQKGDAKFFRDKGVGGYLVKPTPSPILLDAITSVISGKIQGNADFVTRHSVREDKEPEATALFQVAEEDKICVLIAEDNEINRLVVEQMLMGSVYKLVEAHDGNEVIERYKDTLPAIVLMDISMPHRDGYEATREIRAFEEANGLERAPVIGLTAHAMKGERERCLEAGMNDYLAKPVKQGALLTALATWTQSNEEAEDEFFVQDLA